MRRFGFLKVLKIALFGALAVGMMTFLVMSLWNVLMPAIFAVHTISFWQSLGLIVLSKILFGGFRPFGGGPRWRRRMIGRWEQMTPEERQKFKQGLRRGCGHMPNAEAQA